MSNHLTDMGNKTVPHPPYHLDLNLCDFWMFPKLKENLWNIRFENVEEMIETVTSTLDTFTLKDYKRPSRSGWNTTWCIEVGRSYFEGK